MESMSFHPQDDVVLVTGGAGQLGSSICQRLDELGNTVIMSDMGRQQCEDRIASLGLSNTHPLELDVTDTESIQTGVESIDEEFGRLDCLVNNAGIAVFTPFEERTVEEFERVMRVNVYGAFFCAQCALPYLSADGGGSVVNIGSIYGMESPDPSIYGDSGINSSAVYGASKAAIIQMTRYLAVHLSDRDIRVNCVSPGGIFADQDDYFLERYRKKVPLGRMASEDDIVGPVLFVLSDAAQYMTGQNIPVEGGFTIW
jgi:NAD(P)-dependent dehydrogenase (short-subunit alcohol dehydrogenase family)